MCSSLEKCLCLGFCLCYQVVGALTGYRGHSSLTSQLGCSFSPMPGCLFTFVMVF
jgi:hypothetical protein